MRKEFTPDEAINWCMTVGELVAELSKLPQDARLVKFAGGDCDGYVPITKKEFKVVTMGVRADMNTNSYHGAFDPPDAYDKLKLLKKFKAVEL